jgi:ribosomal protein L37AE/L43A
MRTDLAHLRSLTFPCPRCGHNVVEEVLEGIERCPKCGGYVPNVLYHPNPVIAWVLATGSGPIRA